MTEKQPRPARRAIAGARRTSERSSSARAPSAARARAPPRTGFRPGAGSRRRRSARRRRRSEVGASPAVLPVAVSRRIEARVLRLVSVPPTQRDSGIGGRLIQQSCLKYGVQPGSVKGATSISPGRRCWSVSARSITLALPVADPGLIASPFSLPEAACFSYLSPGRTLLPYTTVNSP